MTLMTFRRFAAVLLIGSAAIVGCGKKAEPADKPTSADPAPAGESVRKVDIDPGKTDVAVAPVRDRMHQSFVQATRAADNPPAESNKPPDALKTGTLTFKVMEAVSAYWDDIKFVDAAGKKISYTAQIQTDHGVVELALFPEQAPNHVRNFIALARAGYYDGLCFERIRSEAVGMDKFESLEGGCPEGLGESGMGSIGYWLKDEITPADKMSHDEGVIGACRSQEADTAAGRFYINLGKAPFLDGNYTLFGKVMKGLDVARKIYQRPVVSEDREKEGSRRPEKPVTILKVVIVQN